MIHYLELAFRKFGNTIHLEQDGKVFSYKAFIQPLRRRYILYLKSRISINYSGNNRYLLYIGPKDRPLDRNMRLSYKEIYYKVITTDIFTDYDEDFYVWAVLRPEV